MRAIQVRQFGDPVVLQVQQVNDLQPGPNQVLLRVRAAGVNPVETYIRAGTYAKRPSLPYTPGTDAAGLVEAVGPQVSGVAVGDRVYTSGTVSGAYAEQMLCHESHVHPLPEQLSFAQGAALWIPYGTAYRGLFHRGKATRGEVVLIHGGSGAVGLAALQLARKAPVRVIGTAGTDEGRQLVLEQGAELALDHHAPDYLHHAVRITDGRGIDLILEMLANVNLSNDLEILAPGGRVVVIGSRGRIEIDPRDTMARESAILGLLLPNATDTERAETHAALAEGIKNGSIRPVIREEIPLADAPRAHERVMQSGSYGKIVLVP